AHLFRREPRCLNEPLKIASSSCLRAFVVAFALMERPSMRRGLAIALGCVVVAGGSLLAQSGAKNGEWPTYGGDLGHTRYAALDQINASNFNRLEVAWRFKPDNLGPRPEFQFESTPLMVKGVVYTTAGSRRDVVALDAGTGEMLWMHSENEGARGAAAP